MAPLSDRVAVSVVLLLSVASPRLVSASCRLPIDFPSSAGPSGLALGPRNSLVLVSDGGTVLFADLDDYTLREDTALNDKYTDSYGWFDLEGVAMTNPESSRFLYLGMENKPAILEYEWEHSHKIYRRFDLPGLGAEGVQSMAWVPTDASSHRGYFYVGSRATGTIFIYELPLLESAEVEAEAVLRNSWTPLKDGSTDIAGLAYSGGFIFVSYNEGNSNHVLIYPVLANGMYGELAEQYQVDVSDAQGMAVRQRADGSSEVLFCSDSQRAVFAYSFRFVTGFELHSHCSQHSLRKRSRTRRRCVPELAAVPIAFLMLVVAMAFQRPGL